MQNVDNEEQKQTPGERGLPDAADEKTDADERIWIEVAKTVDRKRTQTRGEQGLQAEVDEKTDAEERIARRTEIDWIEAGLQTSLSSK